MKCITSVLAVAAFMASLLAFSGVASAADNSEQPNAARHDSLVGGGQGVVPNTIEEVPSTASARWLNRIRLVLRERSR